MAEVPSDSDDPATWGPLTPSTQRLHALVGIPPPLRRLTPTEIELLVKSKQEIAQRALATLTRGQDTSLTPSTRLLNQKLGTLHAPRDLTPSEAALLLQSKRELAALVLAARP